MSRGLGLSFVIGLCVACGGHSDNALFNPLANGGGSDPGGSGGSSNASGGMDGKAGSSGGKGGLGSGGTNSTAGTGNTSGGVSSGGAGHAGSGGIAAGGKGNATCEELIDAAYDALAEARACDPSTDIPHCTGFVDDPCGCSVAIEQPESELVRAYAAALTAMEKANCSIACLAIVCYEPVGGVCHENGSC